MNTTKGPPKTCSGEVGDICPAHGGKIIHAGLGGFLQTPACDACEVPKESPSLGFQDALDAAENPP